MRNQDICDAIQNQNIIEFTYDGLHRVVEPHCHGLTQTGNSALRGYQIGGQSTNGNLPNWRMFKLTKASNIRVLTETFPGPRPGYKRGDKGMSYIYSEL